MAYSLFTCLAFLLLVFNFCYCFNPNDWTSSFGGGDSPPAYGLGSGSSGFGSPPGPGFGSPSGPGFPSPPGPRFGSPSGPEFGSPSGPGFGSPPEPEFGSPSEPGFGSPPEPEFGSPPEPEFGSPPSYGPPPSSGSGSGSGSGSPPASGSGPGSGWESSKATWYGSVNGDGSSGGACGYGPAIDSPPFSAVVTSVNTALFDGGNGCGNCFKIKCSSPHCSNQPVTVVVTDSSLGIDHAFDLSNIAFRKLAAPGEENLIQQPVDIQYQQVPCNYNGVKVAFTVQATSNPYYLAVAVEYENSGALTGVDISGTNGQWSPMKRSWGAVWSVSLQGISPPFSFRLTQNSGTLVAKDVIPSGYQITTYKSDVNF